MFNSNDKFFSRRSFIANGLQLLSIAGTLPLFLDHSARAMAADFAANTAGAGRPDDRVLVIVQLAGGNDGLNTVVPVTNDHYYKARPTLAIPRKSALRLTDEWGLHPSCTGLKQLYDAGGLAIVQGVGYPNPNRSHFRSTDIWNTAEPDKRGTTGWLGRYCDAACSGEDPGHLTAEKKRALDAMALGTGGEPPPALLGKDYIPLSVQPPAGGRINGGRFRGPVDAALAAKLNDGSAQMMANCGKPLSGTASNQEFLQRTALNARIYAEKIEGISSTIENKAVYPGDTALGRGLKLIAQLIASDMPTRIYYVKLDGFDTHSNQAANHPALLEDMSGCIAAFLDDLKQLGHLQRTTLMTFSEFGRRVGENGSGTDHGEAAPLFIAGGAVKPGFFGTFPSLAPDKLNRGDVPFTTDFRRVYATMLRDWMKADDKLILGGKFDSIDFMKA